MKTKTWTVEQAFTLVKALELRVAPLGFHVVMVGADFAKKGCPPRIRIYGNQITAADRDNIVSLLRATEMRLQSMNTKDGYETWTHGRGKTMRIVELMFD